MSVHVVSSTATPSSFPPPSSGYDVEYRAIPDDAWYSVRTVIDGEKLTVKYDNFGEEHDNVFQRQQFSSLEEIKSFENRFRPVSVQLQDKECKSLSIGTVICASHSLAHLDVRFYDAVVDDVVYREHSFGDGEEQCKCTFVVVWQHGPVVGCLANKKIENVCLIQSSDQPDAKVAIFANMVREKLIAAQKRSDTVHKDIPSLPMKETTVTKCASQSYSLSKSWNAEERIFYHNGRIKEEVDFGGIGNQYVVLIDNLDKDLSPLTVMEFIHKLISISSQVYIFPSLPSETYTNGAVVLDCKKNFLKFCEFFDSSDQIIISRRGRPWVITAKLSACDSYLVPLGNLMPKHQVKLEHQNNCNSKDLNVVCSGSEEYRTAKQLRDLFMEFSEHQQRLHKRLTLEERKIVQPNVGM